MRSDKHIVIVTPGFAADASDTTTLTFMQEFLLAFKKLNVGITITIVTMQYPYYKGNYSWNGFQVISIGGAAARFPGRLLVWLSTFFALIKINRKQKIDIVQSLWLTEATLIGGLFARLFGKRFLAYTLGQDCKPQNKYLPAVKVLKPEVICISEFLKKQLKKQNIRTDAMIHFGINPEKLKPNVSPRTVDLVAIGSLTTLKNHKEFIAIFSELKKEFKHLKAVIIGNGPERENLQMLISDLRLTDIQILNDRTHQQVFDYLSLSRILVHNSKYEGQSNVIMEAMAAGAHAVCYDVGHIPHEKVHVCENLKAMTGKVRELLNSDLDHTAVIQQTNLEMAQKFLNLYNG